MSKNTLSPNIVLLEDDEDIRDFLSGLLTSYGCNVFLTKTLEETSDILKNNDIGLALLDVMLPGTDGRDVAAYIHQKYPDVAIYFMTGVEDCLDETHMDISKGVLRKPFTIEELKKITYDSIGLPCESKKINTEEKSLQPLELLTAFATEYEALRRKNEKLQEILRSIPQISGDTNITKCLDNISSEHNSNLDHLKKLLEAARLSLK